MKQFLDKYKIINEKIPSIMKVFFYMSLIGLLIFNPITPIVVFSGLSFLLVFYFSHKKILYATMPYKIIVLGVELFLLTLYLYQFETEYTTIVFMIFVYEILMLFPNGLGIAYTIFGYITYLFFWSGPTIHLSLYFIRTISFMFVIIAITSSKKLLDNNKLITQLNHQIMVQNQMIQESTVINERNKIAEEMHDTVGHTLTASIVLLDSVEHLMDKNPVQAKEMLAKSKRLLKDSLSDVRQVVRNLKDTSVDYRLSLEVRIEALIDTVTQTENLNVKLEYELVDALPSLHDYVIYNVIREALTNIMRHSNARNVNIDLHQHSLTYEVNIQDDGIGNDQVNFGFGLNTMRQRVAALGGSILVKSNQETGFAIKVSIPVVQEMEIDDGPSKNTLS